DQSIIYADTNNHIVITGSDFLIKIQSLMQMSFRSIKAAPVPGKKAEIVKAIGHQDALWIQLVSDFERFTLIFFRFVEIPTLPNLNSQTVKCSCQSSAVRGRVSYDCHCFIQALLAFFS